MAIGASRGRLISQLLIESLLLTAIGAGAGAILAQFLSEYLVRFLTTTNNPLFVDLSGDWRVFAFTAGVALVTCILFGLTPALRATRTVPASAMKSSGRGLTADRSKFGLRRLLVISQVALSLVLLVGALLFVRSMRNLLTLDPGFRENGLLIANLDVSRLNPAPARRAGLYRELLDRMRATPGAANAASVAIVQISGSGWNDFIEILGESKQERLIPWFNRVSSGYFATMGAPILAGRDFDRRDTPSSPEVAVVNQEFSKKYLGGASPIGREFRVLAGPGETPHVYQIVGLMKNMKYQNLREDFKPLVFVAASQDKEPDLGMSVIVKSTAPLGSLMSALKRTVLEQSPAIGLQFRVFKTQVRDSLVRERLMATLSGFFGVLAVVLATVGLYGVMSYMVARRRNEIGIRIALGANQTNVLNLVLREAGILLAV